jgi:hypothetical protein
MPTKKTSYTITEAAEKLGISRQAVHKAIRRQLLQAERGTFTEVVIRKGWVISKAALSEYRKTYGVSLSHQERGKKT